MAEGNYTVMPRSVSATALVGDVRHSEMLSISERMERCSNFEWSTMWWGVSTLLAGGLVGGGLGLVPFLSADPGPSHTSKLVYVGVLVVVAVAALFSAFAWFTTKKERTESIAAIKADFDRFILGSFEEDGGSPGAAQ